MNYHVSINGVQQGPFATAQLAAHGVQRETLVWAEGMAQWERADRVPELQQALFAGGAGSSAIAGNIPLASANSGFPPSVPRPLYAPPSGATHPGNSQKMAAGLCGIFLGGFGVHKFILGYTTAGVIMLCASLLTCGVGYFVMHIIGLIEGIMYLCKSDDEFYQTYMLQKKEWF